MTTEGRTRKRLRSPSPTSQISATESVPIVDRESTFLALFSATSTPRTLQSHPSILSATHRILAWRVASSQTLLSSSSRPRAYDTGYDDDGEKYAGKKLENLLREMDVEGAVVVARWYGGVMLGPVRFVHIAKVAKEAISKSYRHLSLEKGSSGRSVDRDLTVKMRKTDKVTCDSREQITDILKQRDQNIVVLRDMLAAKKKTMTSIKEVSKNAKGVVVGEEETVATTPRTSPSYSQMPVDALRRLEGARDATIAWLLRELDKHDET